MTTLRQPPSPSLQSTVLRGQSLTIEVLPGTCLHLQSGHVRVHGAPQWLGARLTMQEHELREGAVHLFEAGGWLLVDGLASSRLSWRQPEAAPSIGQRVSAVLAQWLQRMRQPAATGRAARTQIH